MYLVSIYFDEKTNQRIKEYMKQVAAKTGNSFMLDGNVIKQVPFGNGHINDTFLDFANPKAVEYMINILSKQIEKLHTLSLMSSKPDDYRF